MVIQVPPPYGHFIVLSCKIMVFRQQCDFMGPIKTELLKLCRQLFSVAGCASRLFQKGWTQSCLRDWAEILVEILVYIEFV